MDELLLPLALTLGVPLAVSGAIALSRPPSVLDWGLSALVCTGVAAHMYLAGAVWGWIGFGWRMAPPVAAAVAVVWSARRLRGRPRLPPARRRALAGTTLRGATAALIAGMVIHLHAGGLTPPGAVDLSFPLEAGRYAVVHGGAVAGLNYHRAVPAQAYAVDIVALNDEGRRARGVRPEALEGYEIFDRTITTPCDGVVTGVSDGARDAPIGRADRARPAGNHVLLWCALGDTGITVLLAHLRKGSVAVAAGERVRRGTALGRVGNSGNSSEPHLHIHAVHGREHGAAAVIANATAVALTFNGRFLTRNTIVDIPADPT